MQSKKLGGSGLQISAIGLGTNYVGGHNLYAEVDETEGIRLVQKAVDEGINFIDTADIYGTGRSEELVGKALEGRRQEVVLATKGAIVFDGSERTGLSNRPEYLRQALEASLQRLRTDYVDLYYIHKWDGETPPEDSVGELMRFKQEGKIRAAGVSNFGIEQLKAAAKAGPVDALQSQFNLFQRGLEDKELAFCVQNNISFIPWGPLAYGLLGGRYKPGFTLPENDWRARSGLFDAGVYEASLDIVDKLKSIAFEADVPVSHLAIAWLLSRPGVGSVIAGAKTEAQVAENGAAGLSEITDEIIQRIDALTK